MNHPPDDALNAAWSQLVSGKDAEMTTEPDLPDAALLRAMHATAGTVQPGSVFRDQLWADLSRRPVIAAPTPTAAPSLPGSFANRSGAPTMTPRLAPTGRRWNPPIATIAAALVIALVGYGALSLSGINPSGINLNLNEVPNASAQGQGMAQVDNAVVGTWVIWANAFSDANSVSILIHFEADGTVVADVSGFYEGNGTWSGDPDGRITYQYTAFPQFDQLEDQFQIGDPAVPNFFELRGTFQLSDDSKTWLNQQWSGTTIGVSQSGQPIRLFDSQEAVGSVAPGIDYRAPERLEDLIARSSDATDEQREWLEAGGHRPNEDVNATIQANEMVVPTPTQAQITVTPNASSNSGAMLAPTQTSLPLPTEQASVTPITMQSGAPTPTPASKTAAWALVPKARRFLPSTQCNDYRSRGSIRFDDYLPITTRSGGPVGRWPLQRQDDHKGRPYDGFAGPDAGSRSRPA